jgi:hypothetical protein
MSIKSQYLCLIDFQREVAFVYRQSEIANFISRFFALFLLSISLAACAPVAAPTPTPPPSATPTAVATSTLTPRPTRTSSPTPIRPTALPTGSAGGLFIVTRQLVAVPDADSLTFLTVQGEAYDYQSLQRDDPFSYQRDEFSRMWAMVGEDKLVAAEGYSKDCQQGWVEVTHYGHEVYRIEGGKCSPIPGLWGFFAFDGHWMLETNYYTDDAPAHGSLTLDGVLLNDQYGYEEAFGAQTIAGKLFYFFQRDGKVQAWYDGQEIILGYDEIPHFGCCSASALNPEKWMNMVAFFGIRGDTWYFVQIGTPDSFVP